MSYIETLKSSVINSIPLTLHRIKNRGCCVLCDATTHGQLDLCSRCQSELPANHQCCSSCAKPLQLPVTASSQKPIIVQCGKCLTSQPPFNTAVIPYVYRPPADYLVKKLKYGGDLKFSRVIGKLLADEITARPQQMSLDALLPVPIHKQRNLERGFNQAEQIALTIKQQTGIPVLQNYVVRSVAKKAQSGLNATAREKNMRRAFTISKDVAGMRLAIVDDVYTTGATAKSLARTLLAGGVKEIQVWAFARTT